MTEPTVRTERDGAEGDARILATRGEIVFDQVPITAACSRARFSFQFREVTGSGTIEAPNDGFAKSACENQVLSASGTLGISAVGSVITSAITGSASGIIRRNLGPIGRRRLPVQLANFVPTGTSPVRRREEQGRCFSFAPADALLRRDDEAPVQSFWHLLGVQGVWHLFGEETCSPDPSSVAAAPRPLAGRSADCAPQGTRITQLFGGA